MIASEMHTDLNFDIFLIESSGLPSPAWSVVCYFGYRLCNISLHPLHLLCLQATLPPPQSQPQYEFWGCCCISLGLGLIFFRYFWKSKTLF